MKNGDKYVESEKFASRISWLVELENFKAFKEGYALKNMKRENYVMLFF